MDLSLKIKSSDSSFENEMKIYKVMLQSYKNWNKCFGIGCNKTGSSSLNYIMKSMYGLRSSQSEIANNSFTGKINVLDLYVYRFLRSLISFRLKFCLITVHIFTNCSKLFNSDIFDLQ